MLTVSADKEDARMEAGSSLEQRLLPEDRFPDASFF
jgi:hypothetical protein